jgi:O-antigen ligase
VTDAKADSLVLRHKAPTRSARRPADWPGDAALILPPFILVFGAILDFGAAWNEPALFCAALQSAWALGLTIYYLPRSKPLRLSGLQIAAATAFAALLIWSLITLTPFGRFGVPQVWRLIGSPGALTVDRAATQIEIFKLAGLGAMVLAGLAIAQVERRADRAINLLLWAGVLYAIWAISSFADNAAFVLGREKHYHVDRLTGSFFSANTAASLFGVLALVAWITALRNVRGLIRAGRIDLVRPSRQLIEALLRFAMTGLFWVALLLTISRAAFVATGLCLVLVTVVELVEMLGRRQVAAGKIIGYTAPVVLGMIVLFAATIGQRFVSQFSALGADKDVRSAIFDTYVHAIEGAPLPGFGLGSFRAVNGSLIDDANFAVLWNLGAAHNIYLQWLLEGGIIGAGLMAIAMLLMLADVAGRRIGGETGRTRATIALMVSALLLLHNAVDYSIQVPAIAALWALLLGLGAGVSSRAERRASSGSGSTSRRGGRQDGGAPGSGA